MSIVKELISKDYEVVGAGRWYHTMEHDSLVIDIEKDIFYWNSRNIIGDAFIWLTEVKKLSVTEAREILKRHEQLYRGVYVYDTGNKEYGEVITYPPLVDIFWRRGLNRRTYWYDRLLTDETIDRFKLGYHNEWYMVPFFMGGVFRNFQCRRDDPEKKVRNWYRGVGALLLNSDILKLTNSIVITEGVIDCILLNQEGIPAVGHNTGAPGGFKQEWFKYFFKQKDIYVVFDNDDAGRSGARKIAKILGTTLCRIYTFNNFPERYDIVDYFRDGNSSRDFINLIKENQNIYLR